MSDTRCPRCNCTARADAHRLVALLDADDLDGALGQGLLETQGCAGCDSRCSASLLGARDQRRAALAARERYRARRQRLERRAAAKAAARLPAAPGAGRPPLPPAAASALARAMARARGPAR